MKEQLLQTSKKYVDYINTLVDKSMEKSFVHIECNGVGLAVEANIGMSVPIVSILMTRILDTYIKVFTAEIVEIYRGQEMVPPFSIKFTKLENKVLIINTLEIDDLVEGIIED